MDKLLTLLVVTFALFSALAMAAGCSNAEASESLYLPMHEACPFGEDSSAEVGQFDWALDQGTTDWLLDSGELHLDEATERFPWLNTNTEPVSQGLFVGPTPEATPASAPAQAPSSDRQAARINVNTADADELTELPGIGPALAERILEYRRHRYFENSSQLQRVEGIGPATLENIQHLVRVE